MELYQAPPLRGHSVFDDKRVLLIDPHQLTRDARARVLRSHGIDVAATDSLQVARSLWRSKFYNLILLDVLRCLPGEALEFYVEIKHASPQERFVFLVGPPVYLSRTWPEKITTEDASSGQWSETLRYFLSAA